LLPDIIQRLLVCFVDSDQEEEEIFLCLLALRRSYAHGAPGEPLFIHDRVTFLAETDFTTSQQSNGMLLGRFVCILNTGYAEASDESIRNALDHAPRPRNDIDTPIPTQQ
jgi:hypothetical protein